MWAWCENGECWGLANLLRRLLIWGATLGCKREITQLGINFYQGSLCSFTKENMREKAHSWWTLEYWFFFSPPTSCTKKKKKNLSKIFFFFFLLQDSALAFHSPRLKVAGGLRAVPARCSLVFVWDCLWKRKKKKKNPTSSESKWLNDWNEWSKLEILYGNLAEMCYSSPVQGAEKKTAHLDMLYIYTCVRTPERIF